MNLPRQLLCGSLFALAVCIPTTPSQAEVVSRATVIGKALGKSPQVAAAQARREQSGAEVAQASSARWPLVTLDVGVGPSLRAELVPGTASESTRSRYELAAKDLSVVVGGRLTIVQPLYTFGKLDAFRSAAEHGARARDAQLQMTRAEVALEAARIYEGLLFARDATRFFEELEHYVQRAILSTQERSSDNDAGDTEEDVLRLQTALAAVRLSVHYAQAAQQQARAGLAAYLMLAPAALEPAEDQLRPLAPLRAGSERLVTAALRQRPELTALQHGALAYDSLAAAERAAMLPDVFLLGFADGAYTPGRDLAESRYVTDPLYHFEPGVLLGMRWQIQGSMSRGRGDQRSAQARELRSQQGWAVSGLPAQVRVAFAEVKRAELDIADSRAGVERAKRWMVQANRDYLVGLADSQGLVEAVRAYAELRAAELEATFRYNAGLAQGR